MGNEKRTTGEFSSLQFLLFQLIISLGYSVATDTLTESQVLSVGQTLVSSGQIFELGFFTADSIQYLGIWYMNISGQRPVWVANRGNPLSSADSNLSLSIGSDGNLRLINGLKSTVWSTNVSIQANGTIAVLSDQGNLSLKDKVSGMTLWKSFDYPGDTFIPGMVIWSNTKTGENHSLTSWKTEYDPSLGDFVMGVTNEMPPQAFIWKSNKPIWRSGPWDGWKFIGVNTTGLGYTNGLIVTQDKEQGSVYLTYNSRSETNFALILLTPDGNLKFLNWTTGKHVGNETWEAMEVSCDVYNTCGPFGLCDRSKSIMCQCLKGFEPISMEEWNIGNWKNGCKRRSDLKCNSFVAENDISNDFFMLRGMKVPDHHEYLPLDASRCYQWCLINCSCLAYAHVDGIGCMVWGGDLLDIQNFSSGGVDIFLRLASSEFGKGKKKTELIAVLTTVSGVLLVAMMYCLYKRIANRRVSRSQIKEDEQGHSTESLDLPFFHFNTLAVATNDFSESNKLGAGGFGPVYKGKLLGQEIPIKRLSSHSVQGAMEFKNEVLLISKLQHRNLVRLLGYCIKGDEKLILYEYLKNKSLDTFLYNKEKKVQLDWATRFNIIEGIARGLLYLHRDSFLRIIHRDLKVANILLDDNMNPKISDFGLARAFDVTQELATHRVVETFGYMAPEYITRGIFSEKSDVFSFGILLLEIISGMKNTGFQYDDNYLSLLEYAWHLWNQGTGIDLMDKDLRNSCIETDFMKCMEIGLLCVQDHATERPSMSAVVLMLTGDKDIPQPQRPTFNHSSLFSNIPPLSRNAVSNNFLSVSMAEGR